MPQICAKPVETEKANEEICIYLSLAAPKRWIYANVTLVKR